jgi:hypothetical protein
MKAYLSIVHADGRTEELELHGPLTPMMVPVMDHLSERARATYDHISRIDRERARGKHELACAELLQLVASAHSLLVEPPLALRRARRLADGRPHPHAERVAVVLTWLSERRASACVHYDLWASLTHSD